MKAGRVLDSLVAEKVMGTGSWAKAEWAQCEYYLNLPKPYSTSIEAVWEVVEKIMTEWRLDKPGRNFKLHRRLESWECEIESDFIGKNATASSITAPHAICLATLKAVGVEV